MSDSIQHKQAYMLSRAKIPPYDVVFQKLQHLTELMINLHKRSQCIVWKCEL